jgi:hypothetical protein
MHACPHVWWHTQQSDGRQAAWWRWGCACVNVQAAAGDWPGDVCCERVGGTCRFGWSKHTMKGVAAVGDSTECPAATYSVAALPEQRLQDAFVSVLGKLYTRHLASI